MKSIEDQISEELPAFFPEPGVSLARAIAEQLSSMHRNELIQPVTSTLSNTESTKDSEKQSLNELEKSKYKTELCRNYSSVGFCSYSSRCQFAHGLQELRCRSRHRKYKTQLCRNVLSGYCKYGSRCQFLHNSDLSKDILQTNNSSIVYSTIIYPTAVAIGTYLFTNMLAQTVGMNLEETLAHQSILAALTAFTNISSKLDSSDVTLANPAVTQSDSSSSRITIPLTCGIEVQQNSKSKLTSNIFHRTLISKNQNNNDSELPYPYLRSTPNYQCKSSVNQIRTGLSPDIEGENFDSNIQ